MFVRVARAGVMICLLASFFCASQSADAKEATNAKKSRLKRVISYQNNQDLFYNYQVGPCPSGTVAPMYVSPQPVPAHVGRTYTTYQPLMPHEYLNHHTRSHYGYAQGSGWTRTKVRYRTRGLWWQDVAHNLSPSY